MCGIAGELCFKGIVDQEILRRMTDALHHRGPDARGIYCDGGVGLGHRRLSILDLSSNGSQPMWSEDKSLAIVFNGEVYNFREIRRELDLIGYRFYGESDTEVVVNAIHAWGLDSALKRFIGMFAFALWDSQKKEILLVRDRVGVKPLYYQITSKGLLFASEIKALHVHPNFLRELRPEGVGQFFCFGYSIGESTIYNNTFKLPAGHYLSITQNGDTKLSCYWTLNVAQRGSFTGSYEEAGDRLNELLDSSIAYRLVSDVPVGVFLSGGIDSTLLAVYLKRRLKVDPEFITVGFGHKDFDESEKAALVAKELGLRHRISTVDADAAQVELLKFVEIWDEPFGDTSGIPTSILCREARKSVKVALSGDGGDELFCGYSSYSKYADRQRIISQLPIALRNALAACCRRIPYQGIISSLAQASLISENTQPIAQFEKFIRLLESRNDADTARVMNEKGWPLEELGDVLNIDPGDILRGTPFSLKCSSELSAGFIDRVMRNDFSSFLVDDVLLKVDRASMASSLECRDPLLDHRLVEFAFSLPDSFLYLNGVHKRILRDRIKPWVSSAVIDAPKQGFSIPLYDWIRGPWKPVVLEFLSPAMIRKIGVLNEAMVKKELDAFYRYNGGRAEKIMLMLNFQMWAERWT